jgi:hypothetical protein
MKILFILLLTISAVHAQIDVWHLDEGSGASTADSAGSHPGILENSPQWVGGISGNALKFNGSSQYVQVSSSPILASSSFPFNVPNLTIEAWVKWDGGGAAGVQTAYCEGSYNDLDELGLNSGVPYFTILEEPINWFTVSATASLTTGQWHHLAGVLQAGLGEILYVDGQAVATNANNAQLNSGGYSGESDIGRFANGGSRYFSGAIDEVQLFNAARSASQIMTDYQQYAPGQQPVKYSVDWFKIAGGSGTSTNVIYSITGTVGQPDANQQVMTNGIYSAKSGFWSLISVVQTTGAPTLTLTHSGNNVKISWPTSAIGFVLQQNSDLSTTNWVTSGYTNFNDGTYNSITITSPIGDLFFRLKQ